MSKFRLPDAVLTEIMSQEDPPPLRREKLEKIHELCKARLAAGERDFSVATIGRLATEQKVMNGRGLFNDNYGSFRDLLGVWQAYADHQWLGDHEQLPSDHPNAVLLELLNKDSFKSNRKQTLRGLHEVCRRHHASGSLDWTPKTIGQLCAEQGVMHEHNLVHKDFADFRQLVKAWDDYARPWLATIEAPEPVGPRRIQKSHDTTLDWVRRDYPEFDAWRILAAEWLEGTGSGLNQRIAAFASFFKNYLTRPDVPKTPAEFLKRGLLLPDFEAVACPSSTASTNYNNHIHSFLDWVLIRDFSDVTDDGERIVSPAFRNPLTQKTKSGGGEPDQSVRSPLPYGYVHELRHILSEGPNFKDWTFAQSALGVAEGEKGARGRDWFEVSPDLIDEADPDCVWRVRMVKNKLVHQMWSPVRWVAVLIKLLLPLRTFQVRVLDSGESDTWSYRAGTWLLNDHPLASGKARELWQQGVFRRSVHPTRPDESSTLLYVNTNKTADRAKSGPNKGYVIPWHSPQDPIENVFYWFAKLRDWQAKYNPINVRTAWSELDARHISAKTDEQLASYPDACFLFRMAELDGRERRLPVSDGVVSAAWANLLEELEKRLAARNENHPGGKPIKLIERDTQGRVNTEFPLHSLRVSLVTALALDGEVPFPILQKLVGHSRLLMTLYYTKPGEARISATLREAAERLEAAKEKSIHEFLLNTEHEKLVEAAVCNSPSSLASAIPVNISARNAAGWMPMHHGICLVGGNTSELEDNRKIGGCYNGGPDVGTAAKPFHGPVPGGSRNCIRCRWFVTEPHHLPALAAHFNTVAYHFDEARNKSMEAEHKRQELKRQKARTEAEPSGAPFLLQKELRQAERLWEGAMKSFSDLAEDLVACWRLIERCKGVLSMGPGEGLQLVVQGDCADVQVIFEETESELLQLSGVCENLELYPDLEASKAVIRRSQLLDSALYNEGLPPVFMRLSEEEQLQVGNAFTARLASLANPSDLHLGQREVIGIIDAGGKLSEHLGTELADALPQGLIAKPAKVITLKAIEA